MKLLLLSTEYPPGPGGIGTHALALARGLSAKGWRLTVLTRQDYAEIEEIEAFNRDEPYPIERLPRRRLSRPGRVREVVRGVDPDLVVASGATSVWLASTIGASRRRVAIAHGTELTAGSGTRLKLTRGAFRRMDGVISVSRHTEGVLRRVGVDLEPSVVIPNGADGSRFHPLEAELIAETRTELLGRAERSSRRSQSAQSEPAVQATADGPILLTVGHLSHRKAQDVVIRALPTVTERFPGLRYVMAGLPTRRDDYQRLADELGVGRHVRFLGRVSDAVLPRLYAACDLFVLVSRNDRGDFEGYGIAAVEAALCGRATVATEGSGLAEAVLDGETGLLVPPNDPEATARALIKVLGTEDLAQTLGRAALDRARSEQTWEHRIERYDDFLREVSTR